jgi:glycosyltransferase involved in cell wall biosynthesis
MRLKSTNGAAQSPAAFSHSDGGAQRVYPLAFTHRERVALVGRAPRRSGKHSKQEAAHPSAVALAALTQWDAYCRSGAAEDRAAFLEGADWLLANSVPVAEDLCGWPAQAVSSKGSVPTRVLSAGAQGLAVSVMLRAHWLTGEDVYLARAERAMHTFALDILDGGVNTPWGDAGRIFEDRARYPATHQLAGFLVALLSLHESMTLHPAQALPAPVMDALQRAHLTLHQVVDPSEGAYDAGYWTRVDLQDGALASRTLHKLHTRLLDSLAEVTGCADCATCARRWSRNSQRVGPQLRRFLVAVRQRAARGGARVLRRLLFGGARNPAAAPPLPVLVPITAFPVTGGMRGVMQGWLQAMASEWRMEFLTRRIGPNPAGLPIESFELPALPLGREMTAPSQFPNVWFYELAGSVKLFALLRRRRDYALALPQDGIVTAAFTGVLAKLAGLRVVCVDHGNLKDLFDAAAHEERRRMLLKQAPLKRLLSRLRLALYWPSLRVLARVGTRTSDFFLPASDDMSDLYRGRFGIPRHRITRFPFMIDVARYTPPAASEREALRQRYGLPVDAIVVTLVNRLHPMKGVDLAVRALCEAQTLVGADVRERLRILIVGDGELRAQVEADLRDNALEARTRLLGEAAPEEVARLLGMSDVFLFPARRSINSMAVLEAMAAGCAVVASTTTRHIAEYLAEGRGCAVPVEDVGALADALAATLRDGAWRREMGERARRYVETQHTAEAVRRCLLRASYWTPTLPAAPLGNA